MILLSLARNPQNLREIVSQPRTRRLLVVKEATGKPVVIPASESC
jgi:hypothetical protein